MLEEHAPRVSRLPPDIISKLEKMAQRTFRTSSPLDASLSNAVIPDTPDQSMNQRPHVRAATGTRLYHEERQGGLSRPPLWSTGSVIPMHDEAVKQCQRVIRRSVTCNQGLASLGEGGSQREEKGDEKSDTAMGMLRQKLRKRGYTFRVLGRSKPVFEQNTALAVTGSDDEDVFVDAETGVRSPSPVVDSAHRSHGCRQSQRPSTDGGTRRVGMRRDVSFAGGMFEKGFEVGGDEGDDDRDRDIEKGERLEGDVLMKKTKGRLRSILSNATKMGSSVFGSLEIVTSHLAYILGITASRHDFDDDFDDCEREADVRKEFVGEEWKSGREMDRVEMTEVRVDMGGQLEVAASAEPREGRGDGVTVPAVATRL